MEKVSLAKIATGFNFSQVVDDITFWLLLGQCKLTCTLKLTPNLTLTQILIQTPILTFERLMKNERINFVSFSLFSST